MFSLQVQFGLSLQMLNATTFTSTATSIVNTLLTQNERPESFFFLLNILKWGVTLQLCKKSQFFTGTILRTEVSAYWGVYLMFQANLLTQISEKNRITYFRHAKSGTKPLNWTVSKPLIWTTKLFSERVQTKIRCNTKYNYHNQCAGQQVPFCSLINFGREYLKNTINQCNLSDTFYFQHPCQ
jgi:hypothetical protein